VKRETHLPISPNDMMAVVASTALFIFALAFGGKLLEGYRLRQHNAMLRTEIRLLEMQRQELEARLKEVKTPAYVERVAREEYHWVKPGESLVVTTFREQSAAPAAVAAVGDLTSAPSENETGPYWAAWWELLVGGR
jgi:cell division protein FtsB